jgi:serine/threonine-protein kinase
MLMLYVPEGEFEMGSDDGDYDEQPVHTVVLDGFWIDRTEVTNAQYTLCVADKKCDRSSYADDPDYNGDDHPVVGVLWSDAVAYCEWAGGRLPTEAEWEHAARGPEGRTYPWGDGFDCSCGNFDDETEIDDYVVPGGEGCDGYARTAPVGSFEEGSSWCGALDMAGNVWVWLADWYGDYDSGRQVNPTGPSSGQYPVLRGGSWINHEPRVRSTSRYRAQPNTRSNTIGFRCARDSQ